MVALNCRSDNWRAKYGSMDVSEAKHLRTLEGENRRLKKLLAESMLEFICPADERAPGLHSRCCRSQDDPLSLAPPDAELRTCLRDLANQRRRFSTLAETRSAA